MAPRWQHCLHRVIIDTSLVNRVARKFWKHERRLRLIVLQLLVERDQMNRCVQSDGCALRLMTRVSGSSEEFDSTFSA